MTDSLSRFGPNQLDALREIGNIGGGNAATALAKMLDRQMNMSVPDAQVVPFNAVTNMLKGPESVVTGVLVDMSGDISGYVLLLLEEQQAREMISLILPEELRGEGKGMDYSELESSAILEVSNILVGSFISAISAMTRLTIVPSAPMMCVDMLGAIMSVVAIEYGKMGDSVLFLKAEFADVEKVVEGHFFLIPDYKSYRKLLGSLGMDS